jgi:hypothetical protein
VLQRQFDSLNFLWGAMGDIGDGTVFDLAVNAKGITQKVSNLLTGFTCIHMHSGHSITQL